MAVTAVIGGGSIGVAFGIVFARSGHDVRIQDPDGARRSAIPGEIRKRLCEMEAFSLLDEPLDDILQRITVVADLDAATEDAVHVQECVPELLPLKQELFAKLDRLTPPDAILASSSSAIPISQVVGDLPGRARCLVAHPANPPHLLPVVELVPASFTHEKAVIDASAFFEACGLSAIRVRKEVEGFVFNRLQGALLREAYCLVRDGIADVGDIDRLVTEALGLRWSVIGPFETADLNTRGGIAAHARKLGPAYARMGAERGQDDPWTDDLVAKVSAHRRAALPLQEWEDRVAWRDRELARLRALRKLGLDRATQLERD